MPAAVFEFYVRQKAKKEERKVEKERSVVEKETIRLSSCLSLAQTPSYRGRVEEIVRVAGEAEKEKGERGRYAAEEGGHLPLPACLFRIIFSIGLATTHHIR